MRCSDCELVSSCFSPPIPKKYRLQNTGSKMGRKCPSLQEESEGRWFLVLEQHSCWPEEFELPREIKHIVPAKKQHDLRNVRTAHTNSEKKRGMADGLRHTRYLTKVTAHVGEAMSTRGRAAKAGKCMRPHAAEGWQGAAATSMTALCALSIGADAAALWAVCFCCRAVNERSSTLWGSGACDRATSTPHSTPHARNAPR